MSAPNLENGGGGSGSGSSGAGGRSKGKDGAAEVLVVVDVVELDIDALDEPLAGLLLGVEDGDSADTVGGDGGLGELGGPDEGDLLAVEGADLVNDDRDEIGLSPVSFQRSTQPNMAEPTVVD